MRAAISNKKNPVLQVRPRQTSATEERKGLIKAKPSLHFTPESGEIWGP